LPKARWQIIASETGRCPVLMLAPYRTTMPMRRQEYLPNIIRVIIVKQIEADFDKDKAQKEVIRKR